MSAPTEPGTVELLLFLAKKFRQVGTKYKVELATSQLFSWIALLPPALLPRIWFSNVRSRIEDRLAPYQLPLKHVDTMKDAVLEVSSHSPTVRACAAQQ